MIDCNDGNDFTVVTCRPDLDHADPPLVVQEEEKLLQNSENLTDSFQQPVSFDLRGLIAEFYSIVDRTEILANPVFSMLV